jgi:hypothetical protein
VGFIIRVTTVDRNLARPSSVGDAMDIICENGRHFSDLDIVKACSESRGGCDRCLPTKENKTEKPTHNGNIEVIWPKDMPPASWHN